MVSTGFNQLFFSVKARWGRGQVYEKECHLYAADVVMEFNETAYNNEDLFSRWIQANFSKIY